MNILLCNERFLFRFGVDRVLLRLAEGFVAAGHQVTLMGNKCDLRVIQSGNYRFIEIPQEGDYINLNNYTLRWLEEHWGELWTEKNLPNIVMLAGWPFYEAIPFFVNKGLIVTYSDHGAVPLKGFEGRALDIQLKLQELRKKYVPFCDAIIPVSYFIATEDSAQYTGVHAKRHIIYSSADHLEKSLWVASNLEQAILSFDIAALVEAKKHHKIILNLGRWENGNYKNSSEVFNLASELKKHIDPIKLLILGDKDIVDVPPYLAEDVTLLGFPDDLTLQKIMKLADLGISVSLWEGFNLPLAEMQYLSKPVLVFDVGAHKEVVVDDYFLCRNNAEMIDKAIEVLSGRYFVSEDNYRGLRKYFRWQRTVEQYLFYITETVSKKKQVSAKYSIGINPAILIDVTNASRDPANSGVIRLTRRLARELQDHTKVFFVIWSDTLQAYVYPTSEEYLQLSQYNGPLVGNVEYTSRSYDNRIVLECHHIESHDMKWLLLTETVMEYRGHLIRQFAQDNKLYTAAIFHDAIPLTMPEFVKDAKIRENHADYMSGLRECTVIMPNSYFSAQELKKYWRSIGSEEYAENIIQTCPLPGEYAGVDRPVNINDSVLERDIITMLCVSTLEPRKNHRNLLTACLLLQERRPELEWELVLVGNRYAGADDIADYVQSAMKQCSRIKWLGITDDKTLAELYSNASFTIYPSVMEGYGLPIMESLWCGKPCICHNEGVMSELAQGGGCLTANTKDVEALYSAIEIMATSVFLRKKLAQEAITRPIKSWIEYGQEILHIFRNMSSMDNFNIDQFLYPDSFSSQWQMSHSERLALEAILQKIRPECSIEIGTFHGGSLSLLKKFSKHVYSIDIDASIPEKLGNFHNVTYLTGPSEEILPQLLEKLNTQNCSPDFILIDGDHSKQGVMRDLQTVLRYAPSRNLVVMMHDSFNPECRLGMLEVDWESSPYLQWVDLDFIPGRIIEHGGGGDGELWGGLGLACFSPHIRKEHLWVQYSAAKAHALLSESDPQKAAINPVGLLRENSSINHTNRILICSNAYPPNFIGGAELIAHQQAIELLSRGYAVQVFAGDASCQYPRLTLHQDLFDGINIHRLSIDQEDFNLGQSFLSQKAKELPFEKILDEFQPNIILFHNIKGLSLEYINIANRRGIKVLVTLHDHWGFCIKNTLLRPDNTICITFMDCSFCTQTDQKLVDEYKNYTLHTLQKADILVSPSHYLAEIYIRAGFSSQKIKVVNNGISFNRFDAIEKQPSKKVRYSFIGILEPHKGIGVLLEAFALMRDRDRAFLNIVGSGGLESQLKDYVHANQMEGSVHFWGKLDNARIHEVYAETDVYVLPSIWPENQPVTITEAMASSLPVIASNIGGNPELVEDGVTGFLFKAGNVFDLSWKMHYFLGNPTKLSKMGKAGRAKIENFTILRNVNDIVNVMEL